MISSSRLFSSTEENEIASATKTALQETAKEAAEETKSIVQQDEEWEFEEYEELLEDDFVNSEWLVGTNFDSNPSQIKETWVRCLMGDDTGASSQPCIWGDGSKGKWSFDRASQYFSLSKEHFYGKEIWAGVVEDYYYLQGTVRGWTYITPAEVLGQWQAKRLGVDKEEAGIAPWFEQEEDENGSSDDDDESKSEENESDSRTETTSRASDATAAPSDESEQKEDLSTEGSKE